MRHGRARSLPLSATIRSEPSPSRAPDWHLGALLVLIVSVAATGSFLTWYTNASSVAVPSPSHVWGIYVPAIAVNWALVFYVTRIGRARGVLAALLTQLPFSLRGELGGLGWAAVGWVTIETCEALWARLFAAPHGSVASMLPTSPAEQAVWVVFALSAGFCEEVVYRGYLQCELSVRTHRPLVGVLLQAALFGLAHLQQGVFVAARLAVYGFALGLLARFRRSLWPGIVCHAGIDLASGLWLR